MRIAVVHPFTWADVRRGGERYAHDLAWWLAAQGHAVDYVTGGPAHGVTTDGGVRMVRLHHRHGDRLTGWGLDKTQTFGVTVLPWLARHRYDVVHAFVPSAAVASRMARQRTVFTAIGHPTPHNVGSARRLLVAASRAAHVTTALSQSAADGLAAVVGRTPLVLPPGVRADVFTPNIAPRLGPARLLFAAQAGAPHKRLTDLLAAMPQVLAARPQTRLVVGGGGAVPGGLPAEVAAAVDDIGTGSLEELREGDRSATVKRLPSLVEALGLVLVESLACGTPVVAARSGGMPEIVGTDAGVGALTAVGDPAALADAILATIELAADPETPVRCVRHAEQWSWDQVGPRHVAAYDTALTTPSARSK